MFSYIGEDEKKALSIKEKFDWTSSKLTSAISFKKMKGKPQSGRKYSQYLCLRKDLYPEYIKRFYNSK